MSAGRLPSHPKSNNFNGIEPRSRVQNVSRWVRSALHWHFGAISLWSWAQTESVVRLKLWAAARGPSQELH